MTANTKIEWCDATVNWWAGCMKVSPGCDNCYAERMAGRLWGVEWVAAAPRHQFQGAAEALRALDRKAARLGRPLSVFHNSVSDFFDPSVPVQWRISALRVMLETKNLIHLLLTKRIGNAAAMLETAFRAVHAGREGWADNVPAHIWIGATIVNQPEADRDIAKLLAVPAAKRFLSMEPLLGAVDLRNLPCGEGEIDVLKPDTWEEEIERWRDTDADWIEQFEDWYSVTLSDCSGPIHSGIDWVIVGGESGPNARPMHPDWARSLRDQCEAAGVPFFFKQWGEWMPESSMTHELRMRDFGQFETLFIKLDGSTHWIDREDHTRFDASDVRMIKVGKKAAGRLLDGREWNEVPT